jgi:hypothetical protein
MRGARLSLALFVHYYDGLASMLSTATLELASLRLYYRRYLVQLPPSRRHASSAIRPRNEKTIAEDLQCLSIAKHLRNISEVLDDARITTPPDQSCKESTSVKELESELDGLNELFGEYDTELETSSKESRLQRT